MDEDIAWRKNIFWNRIIILGKGFFIQWCPSFAACLFVTFGLTVGSCLETINVSTGSNFKQKGSRTSPNLNLDWIGIRIGLVSDRVTFNLRYQFEEEMASFTHRSFPFIVSYTFRNCLVSNFSPFKTQGTQYHAQTKNSWMSERKNDEPSPFRIGRCIKNGQEWEREKGSRNFELFILFSLLHSSIHNHWLVRSTQADFSSGGFSIQNSFPHTRSFTYSTCSPAFPFSFILPKKRKKESCFLSIALACL